MLLRLTRLDFSHSLQNMETKMSTKGATASPKVATFVIGVQNQPGCQTSPTATNPAPRLSTVATSIFVPFTKSGDSIKRLIVTSGSDKLPPKHKCRWPECHCPAVPAAPPFLLKVLHVSPCQPPWRPSWMKKTIPLTIRLSLPCSTPTLQNMMIVKSQFSLLLIQIHSPS